MRRAAIIGLALLALAGQETWPALAAQETGPAMAAPSVGGTVHAPSVGEAVRLLVRERFNRDVAALERFRPAYGFWQHIFLIPDGSIAYGSGNDGRLLATFPSSGDWKSRASWEDPTLWALIEGSTLAGRIGDRREQVARLLEPLAGPVVHNPTRGTFLLPNARRYGSFLDEWSLIYERFGVPGELGLAQAIVESGLNGGIRSEAGAIGLCQWMPRNWERLKRLSANVIEAKNQTTQAPYCAAYLAILGAKYGTFVPALSEHHAGMANVGRTVINGSWLGGRDVREQYFLGSAFARDLRAAASPRFSALTGTYGPRSFAYAEMVFGNAITVTNLRASTPQQPIFAMRAPRSIGLAEITRHTGLSADEVRRFNPALVNQVPKGANLYLPSPVEAFGRDVSFWHRPAPPAFDSVLGDFLALEATPEEWEAPAFEAVLARFRARFLETGTDEGAIMGTMISYVMGQLPSTHRVLARYRASAQVQQTFEAGVRLRESAAVAQDVLAR
jgi:hypothetical protein